MTGREAVPRPSWTSTLAVRLNLSIAGLLVGVVILLGVVTPCSSRDLCLGSGAAGWLLGLTFLLLVSLALSGVLAISFGLALIDVAIAAATLGLSLPAILAVDIGGMLAISAAAAVPLAGGVRATRQAAYSRLERWVVLGGLIAIAAAFVITPKVGLGALVPLLVLPAIAFPMTPPWPYGEGHEPGATLVGHGEDREE